MQKSYFYTHGLMLAFVTIGIIVAAFGVAKIATMDTVNPSPMEVFNALIFLTAGASTLAVGLIGRAIVHIAQNTAISAEHLSTMASEKSEGNQTTSPKSPPPVTRQIKNP